jgi:hypothetical protein
LWHGFALGTQAVPATQTLHVPPRHTSEPPHAAASGWNAVSVQTGAPLAQTVDAAVAQAEGVQAAPSVHAVQTPLVLQTPVTEPDVQGVPALANVASTQTGAPVEHAVDAEVAQGLEEVQAAPSVHAVQTPLVLQTPVTEPDVQGVPALAKVASAQTGAPVVQSVDAVSAQGLLDVHVTPAEQGPQVLRGGPLHTSPEPQVAPAPWKVRSVQTGAPLLHSIVALVAQRFADVQVAPWVHAVHTPALLQTPAAPPDVVQAVPAGVTKV